MNLNVKLLVQKQLNIKFQTPAYPFFTFIPIAIRIGIRHGFYNIITRLNPGFVRMGGSH